MSTTIDRTPATTDRAHSSASKPAARRPTRKPRPSRAERPRDPAARARTIAEFMTARPFTIGRDVSLAVAHDIMRTHGIRHLPVLHAGALVGIVSQRDLHLVETLRDVDPTQVSVAEAMTEEVLAVAPSALLDQVAEKMAALRCGSAVVVERGQVVGVFTTVDALRAIGELLRG